MSTQVINPKLFARLKDKKYRDLFIASQINKIIPYQIRALRAARNDMTQAELAERAETTQSVISRIQSKGAANLNIKSLLKLASAFDVALVVRFEPIDRFIDWVDELSPEVMSPRLSEEILEKIEREDRERAAAGKGESSAGTGAPLLRLVPVKTAPMVPQQTLPFSTASLLRLVQGTPFEQSYPTRGKSTEAGFTFTNSTRHNIAVGERK